jgi:flagellar operon protein
MANAKINNMLIPNVTKLPSQKNVDTANKLNPNETSEFKSLLDTTLDQSAAGAQQEVALPAKKGIHLSTHALKRLQERNLTLDKEEYAKLQTALDRLKVKGGQDSLVITDKAAYILDVPKNMIVTAIDKGSISENVFTKIDSTILMN